jgi:radical SAM superfamily enzyme YgiQ (UPF0313 family)
MTPFPGTPLYERLKREGRLLREDAWELCTLFDVNFIPQRMSVRELEENFVALARDLYGEPETRRRKAAFYRQLRSAVRHRLLQGRHYDEKQVD